MRLSNLTTMLKAAKQTPAQQDKVHTVMQEFKQGKLKSSTGKKVTKRDQAVAIAMSEAGVPKKAGCPHTDESESHGDANPVLCAACPAESAKPVADGVKTPATQEDIDDSSPLEVPRGSITITRLTGLIRGGKLHAIEETTKITPNEDEKKAAYFTGVMQQVFEACKSAGVDTEQVIERARKEADL